MKKILTALCSFIFICSCSPESTPGVEPPQTFEVDLNASSLALEVDEMATITVETEVPLKEVAWMSENLTRTFTALTGESLPADMELYFQFPNEGIFPVKLKFTGITGEIIHKELQFEVVRGSTVQITGIQVNNYYKKGETWDADFSEDDPKRLADLIFALEKTHLYNFAKKEYSTGSWYLSEVLENESSFTWDLSEKGLFLNPIFGFHFSLADTDEGNLVDNVMVDYPSYFIDLRPYRSEKPESVSLIDEAVDLDITIFLDWR